MTDLRRKRALAFLALFFGGAAIAFSPIFVRLADDGPMQSAFWRVALAVPFLAVWAVWAVWNLRCQHAHSTLGGAPSIRMSRAPDRGAMPKRPRLRAAAPQAPRARRRFASGRRRPGARKSARRRSPRRPRAARGTRGRARGGDRSCAAPQRDCRVRDLYREFDPLQAGDHVDRRAPAGRWATNGPISLIALFRPSTCAIDA